MKIEDNHYTYRIETKDSNGGSLDFIDIDTVEPLRCAYDVQDELNLETNEHIKRVEEVVLDANSTEFWYVDEARTSDTHLVCYFEEVELMASKDHPMVDTNRSIFEYGKINSNEHQNTNFICTHVMDNGVSRIYMSIDKETFGFSTFNNETIKHFISNHPTTVWYALRYEVVIPRSMSKGHLLTLSGQTDITLTTTSEQAKLPIMKFNIGDTQYTLDGNPIHINNTQEGTQIRNIVLEGNTPINYARGNGVNTTEQESNTRYDFEPFYDGQTTIQGTVEGGYVSAKLYGDTMVNIAKPYGETPLLTANNKVSLCDDLLGTNEEGVKLTDGEITEGKIYGNSIVNYLTPNGLYVPASGGNTSKKWSATDRKLTLTCLAKTGTGWGGMQALAINDAQKGRLVEGETYTLYFDIKQCTTNFNMQFYGTSFPVTSNSVGSYKKTFTYNPNKLILFTYVDANNTDIDLTLEIEIKLLLKGNYEQESPSYIDGVEYFEGIGSVVNPTVYNVTKNLLDFNMLKNGTTNKSYIEIPVKVQQGVTYHYVDDYGRWNGSNIFSATLTGIRGDGSTVAINHFINGSGVNRVYQNFTVSTKNNYEKIVLRFPLTTKDEILSKVTKMGIFEGSYYDHEITPHHHTQITTTHTLNKLPNGVADYIDVVNKVHVQRVGKVTFDGTETERTWIKGEMHSNNPQKDNLSRFYYGGGSGYNDLKTSSSMLSDKLPYANVAADRSEIESVGHMVNAYFNIIIRKDRLVTDDADGFKTWLQSNPITILHELATPIYTPLTDEEIAQLPLSAYKDGYVMLSSDQLMPSFEFRMRASNRYQVDMLETGYYYLNAPVENVKLGTANVDVQQMPCIIKVDNVGSGDSGYRLGLGGEITDTTPITLAKLPSHRIPTSFTQGMKCMTDFGYWEGIIGATGKQLYVNETNKLDFAPIELNRIEYNNTIVEDEFDIATSKLTKRIGKVVFDGSSDENWYSRGRDETYVRTKFFIISLPTKSRENYICINNRLPYDVGWNGDFERLWIDNRDSLVVHTDKAFSVDSFRKYLASNPIIVYYPLEVPEISCVDLPLNTLRTLDVATTLQVANQSIASYLLPQVKPSHLTYPVPSLVGNRTYTVVHNRKNITGSTKPIELNLGGTVVQLNDASSKTLVKTPSTLAHSNLIFIGGESTVDHIMVLDGDWTNKPIEYFENMKGHDTDAIITIIGDGKIDDVAEQYLW